MSLRVSERGYFTAFSMLVDINGFTALVANNKLDIGIGTFVRDVFSGAITDASGQLTLNCPWPASRMVSTKQVRWTPCQKPSWPAAGVTMQS